VFTIPFNVLVTISSIFFARFNRHLGLILSKALKAQKDSEDESTKIAFGNLRSEIITLWNEALEKDKILLSLVKRLKTGEANLAKLSEVNEKILKFEKEKKQMQNTWLI
jgi:hypothetical protein